MTCADFQLKYWLRSWFKGVDHSFFARGECLLLTSLFSAGRILPINLVYTNFTEQGSHGECWRTLYRTTLLPESLMLGPCFLETRPIMVHRCYLPDRSLSRPRETNYTR
jgi:hypothetical protein